MQISTEAKDNKRKCIIKLKNQKVAEFGWKK